MCLLVDANICGDFFNRRGAFSIAFDWVHEKGCLVYGGQLKKELEQNPMAERILTVWYQSGHAYREDDEAISIKAKQIRNSCCSTDPHILAVAILSKSRLLCTNDGNLIKDFTGNRIITNPKGKIFRYSSHRHLLKNVQPCRWKKKKS